MKKCSTCKQEKLFELFSKNKSIKDGYSHICKSCFKEFYYNNKIKLSNRSKIYYKENKETYLLKVKKYKLDNKEIIKQKNKEYREKNKEKIKKYREENREILSKYSTEYFYKRKQVDSLFKLKCSIKTNICGAFKRGTNQFKKTARTEEILGCTIEEFIKYIESKFTEGMTIDNHGEWHLDHINPLALATTEEEVVCLNHYTNFQPLWAIDNLIKGSKI
jgi:hypothetical protein